MFGHDPPKAKEPIDYTGLKIGAISGTGASAFYLFWQRRHGTCGFHYPGGEYICHQDALEEFEETHLVLGDHCCYLGASHPIIFYGSMAPRKYAYAFLHVANRNR